jgi:hypothetical protein
MWNVLWSWSVRPPRLLYGELLTWQRVNHFPEARQLTRKDLLKKHLARYQVRRHEWPVQAAGLHNPPLHTKARLRSSGRAPRRPPGHV